MIGSKKRRTMKLLIVNGSAIIRERLKAMLSELAKIEIIGQAQDADEALTSIRKLNPDVVILDIGLPRGNGIDLLQKIKKYKPAPIVIIFTLYSYPQYRKKCMDAGAEYFFNKSTEFKKITEVLKKIIKKSST